MSIHRSDQNQEPRKLIPITEWANIHGHPTASTWRAIRYEGKDPLNNALIKIAGRVVVDEKRFFEIVDLLNGDSDSHE